MLMLISRSRKKYTRLGRFFVTMVALVALSACSGNDSPGGSNNPGDGAFASGGNGSYTGGASGGGVSGTGGAGNQATAGTGNAGTSGVTATGGSPPPGGVGGALTGGNGGVGGEVDGGAGGSGGRAGSSSVPVGFVNNYDGARTSTESFDLGWKFNLGDAMGAQAATFDDSSWASLDVPHDWSISLPFNQNSAASFSGGYLDGGVGWYRKTFTLPAESAGQRIFIQFDGVYMDSTVWVNDTQVCERPYGYSSFECDITSVANIGGSNLVAVRVNNQQPSSRWYSGSGIYRHVWLKTVNPVRVEYTGTHVTTPQVSADSATVNIVVIIKNDAAGAQSVTLTSTVYDNAGAEVGTAASAETSVAAGGTADVAQTVTVPNPELWSPESPSMYSVVTTVSAGDSVVDTYRTPLGIRTFAFDANTGFSLNGTAMKINGVCNHHDLGALGAATNYRAIEKRMQMLKDMGANAVRTAHNPPAPELLDIADRLGFLVMDEAFDCWYAGKNTYDYGRFFRDWADRDMKSLVGRDRNHPSVIIWSFGNEVAQAGDRGVVQQLIDDIRSMDDTRVITQAYAAWVGDDSFTGLEDIVGINYAPDRYDWVHTANPTWKLIASESSSGLRSRGIYNNNNTQCSSYDDFAAGWGHTAETSWRNVNTRPWIAGEFVWTGFDYIGEPTPYEWPAKSSYFGIIDTANFPKDVYYFYQSKWNAGGPTMVHIVPMNWTTWTNGQPVKVLVYTNADSVDLLLNGASQGSKTMDIANTGKLEWSVSFAPGTLEARASKGGTVVVDTVQTAGPAAALVATADRASIAADGRDLSFVEVDVFDAQGVIVPNASDMIDFTISGPGKIVGVDNGDATSHESYTGTSRSAFSGKALAIVRSTTTAGTITLNAASGMLTGGSVDITTTAP
jgi:beta-galactosidase